VVNQLPAQLSSISTVDQDGAAVELTYAQIGAGSYLLAGAEILCQGTVLADDVDAGSVPDPTSLLPFVIGAERKGEETVNGIAAVNYTFDGRSIAAYRGGKAIGSLWVAQDGGWLVKFTLEIEAPRDVLGAGLEGKQTWFYEVTEVGAIESIDLPPECEPVLVDFPVTPGAQEVERLSGSLYFSTAEGLDQVNTFYREQLTAAGWSEADMFESSTHEVMLNFTLPGDNVDVFTQKVASLLIRPSGPMTEVIVVVIEEELPDMETPPVP
jgi:hypothetical protein